jgi:hypothetical protein
MIWNDATNVIWNGSTVNAVICNGAQIWPNAEPEPDAWTMFAIDVYDDMTKSSQIGFDIYDGMHRKVYSTEGLHDISSYGSAEAVASGIAPFYVSLSGSGCPYNALTARPSNSTNTALLLRRSTVEDPGTLVVTTAQLKDSKTNSSSFPTSTADATLSNVSYVDSRAVPKTLEVSGKLVANWLPVDGTGSAQGVMILTTFDVPYSASLPPYYGVTSTAFPPGFIPSGLGRSGVKAGYFTGKTERMLGNVHTDISAFNFFNSLNHSGNISLSVVGAWGGISSVHGNAPYTDDGLFLKNIVTGSSVNPYSSFSGEYATQMFLSGKNNFSATAHEVPRHGAWSYTLTDEQCNGQMYYGYWCYDRLGAMQNFSKFVRTATSTNGQHYTASVVVE